MSKTFRTVGSGSTQTLEKIENNKIPIYETKAAAEADIANLTDGQLIATKDEGNENAKPVDVVESGNLHAVTSNAVADFAFDKNNIRTGFVTGGSANSDNWKVVFDTPFPDNEYRVFITPVSAAGKCPTGWYGVIFTSTGFSIYCNGTAPTSGFAYLAIHL